MVALNSDRPEVGNKPEVGNSVQGRLVAIDATVQRRPPGGLVSAEDAACNRLTELALNDVEVSVPCTTPGCSVNVAHPAVSGKGAILSGVTQHVKLSWERTLQIFTDVDHSMLSSKAITCQVLLQRFWHISHCAGFLPFRQRYHI